MTANKKLSIITLGYIIIFTSAILYSRGVNFSGVSGGLAYGYGLLVLLILGLIATILNVILVNKVTIAWLKLLVFIPIILPSITILVALN